MKNIKILGLIALTASVISISSCSEKELDRVNFNPNNPSEVGAKYILTEMMTSSAFSVSGGDVSLYSSIYLEHETGVWGQTYNADIRVGEPTQATTYNNVWNSVYANIKSLKIAIAKTSAGGAEEGNDVTQGIAKVLLAFNLGVLTDLFGDVPFSESGVIDETGAPLILQPKIDKQSELYPQIQQLLDEAIVLLDGTDAISAIGSQDLIYGGNKALWKKAAYGLKARYLMHTMKISTDVEADMTNVLDFIDNSFASASEELKFNVYDGQSNINPLFGYSNARDGLGVSESLAKKFKALEDPRGEQAFMEYTATWFAKIGLDQAIDEAAPNGTPTQQQYTYPLSVVAYAATAPTIMMSYHELMFLKAEALARLGQLPQAKDALKAGLIAAFANMENSLNAAEAYIEIGFTPDLSEDVATDYFDNKVAVRFDAEPLKEIMLQKYLAFYGASGEATEAYNDYRRLKALGEDYIDLENPLNASNKFPLRFTYGNSDVSANPNVKSAYGDGNYVYTENVWWAGGSR